MRRLFWGGAMTPFFYARDYGSYRTHLLAGKTWFGTGKTGKRRFGSGGTATQKNYATSKMVKTKGFKSTQYVKSGGTYRGARHNQTASSFGGTSYGGSRYQSSGNSSRSSGSHSSTRRSSTTRRSSFGGSRRR
jgi:hypothetical protein